MRSPRGWASPRRSSSDNRSRPSWGGSRPRSCRAPRNRQVNAPPGTALLVDGARILIAGPPGSGRTTLAAREITALVAKGIPAHTIALCSRTEALAALALDMAPPTTCAGLWSGTIAGLAQEILRQHPRSGRGAPFRILDDVGAMQLISANAIGLPTSAFGDPTTIGERVARLYRTISLAGTRAGPPPSGALHGELVDAYNRLMAAENSVATADCVRSCLALLEEDGDVMRHVAGRWRYVLVDDAEEATAAEAALIGLLARAGTRVMALVAPDHAAFRSWGADPSALTEMAAAAGFERIDIADAEARQADAACRASRTPVPPLVELSHPRNLEDEARAVRSTAERWRASGVALERQVVVALRHSSLTGLRTRLTASGVAVERVGDLFSSEAVLDLLEVARLPRDLDGSAFRRVADLGIYGLAPSTSEAFLRSLRAGVSSLDLLLRPAAWPSRIAPAEREKLGRMAADLRSSPPDSGPWRFVTAWLFGSSGYLASREHGRGPLHAAIECRAIRDFLGVCEEQHRIGDTSAENLAARMRRLRSRLQETNHSRDPRRPLAGVMRIMTIHEAKGRTFEAVHLIGLADWKVPRAGADDRAEEALFEIAISRASRLLHVSRVRLVAQDRVFPFVAEFERLHRRVTPRSTRKGVVAGI